MDKLTKDQKDEYATSFAALALYDGGVSYFKSCALKNVHKNWLWGVCCLSGGRVLLCMQTIASLLIATECLVD